jgi:hypothetical protein
LYIGVADCTGPLAAYFHELMDTLFGRSLMARHILAFLIIFFQSAYLGIMFINKKVFNENTYIPSLIFSTLYFFSFDTLTLSNELLGSGFLLLALNNLFKEIEFRIQQDETIFNLGLFISLASLFAFSFIVYLFCAIIILFLFTRTNGRKFFLLIFGFLLPHLLIISIGYLNHSLSKMWEFYYLGNIGFGRQEFISVKSLITLSILPLVYVAVSLVMLNREARFSKYQSQLLQSMFIWIAFSLIYILYAKDLRPQSLVVLIPGFTFLLTHFLLFIRRKKFAEINILILLIGIVSISYLARFNNLGGVDYNTLLIQEDKLNKTITNKKILVLGPEINAYQNNKLATPYLNWNLSTEIFTHPEYYENITEVYHAFKNDPPALVIDHQNLLKPFFDRMPEIKKMYVRRGNMYIRN